MAASFRRGCSRCRGWAASTCMLRCCPSIAAPRRSSGRSPWAMRSPATRPCCLKKVSTRDRFLLQQTVEIGPDQTAAELVSDAGARRAHRWWWRRWLGWRMERFGRSRRVMKAQRFAPLLDREDGRMDFAARTAHELYNRWRGFQPWPGAFTALNGKKLIVHRMAVRHSNDAAVPASLNRADPGEKMVACLLPAPAIRGSNSSRCSSKARSA